MDLQGRTVLLTGAAGGLGAPTARVLTDHGAQVVLLDLPDSDGQRIADGLEGARFLACDLGDLAAAQRLVREFADAGPVDVLVNNAAIYPSRAFDEYDLDEYRRVQQINADAAFALAQAVYPGMRDRGWGRIVNVASITFFGGWANLAPYVASKGSLIGLTHALARELGEHGITVNAIAPGAFPTAAEQIHPDPEGYQRFVLEHQAIKRRGAPEDVGNVVSFLASDAAGFVTGQVLNVDGGWVMQ